MQRMYTFLVLSLVCLLTSCEPEIEPVELHFGSLTLDKYISVGDSYTAGASNGGIYRASQEFSYPALVTQQIREVQQIPFNQPYLGTLGTGYLTLERVLEPPCQEGSLIPTFMTETGDMSLSQNISNLAPFHNLGVPGLVPTDVERQDLASVNSFFGRMIRTDLSATYIDLLEQVQGDLISIWLGIEAVVDFASKGQIKDSLNEKIFQSFGTHLDTLITSLYRIDNQSTVLVGDIPDVVSFPFFSSFNHVYLDSLGCQPRPLFIEYTKISGEIGVREATEMDRILLVVDGKVGSPLESGEFWGLSENHPIPDSMVLDQREVQQVRALIAGYNRKIQEVVAFHNENTEFPHQVYRVSLSQQLNNVMAGQTLDGSHVSATYLTGGVFSIDGYTFSPRGKCAYRKLHHSRNQSKFPGPNSSFEYNRL